MSDTVTSARTTADPSGEVQQARTKTPRTRKLLLSLLAASVVVAGAGYGTYYYTTGRFFEVEPTTPTSAATSCN